MITEVITFPFLPSSTDFPFGASLFSKLDFYEINRTLPVLLPISDCKGSSNWEQTITADNNQIYCLCLCVARLFEQCACVWQQCVCVAIVCELLAKVTVDEISTSGEDTKAAGDKQVIYWHRKIPSFR